MNHPFPKSYLEKVIEYREKKTANPELYPIGRKLIFLGAESKDVYNGTSPFELNGKTYLAARVENPGQIDAQVMFFIQESSDGLTWRLDPNIPPIELEDPFFSLVEGHTLIGGTLTEKRNGDVVGYRVVFYKADSLQDLQQPRVFLEGPEGMKDIRLLNMPDGVLVFTRPKTYVAQNGRVLYQGSGEGKIGVLKLSSLKEFGPESLIDAPMLENQVLPSEWLGANQLFLLEDGRVGVLAHMAMSDYAGPTRHYSAASFIYDPNNHEATDLEILVERSDFAPGKVKTVPGLPPDNIADCIFAGGAEIEDGEETILVYCGLSDAEMGAVRRPNPFI